MNHQRDEDLGLIPDPEDRGGRGERAEIVAEGETMAIVTTRVALRDINTGAGAEIDRREENVGERGEGMVEIGGGGGAALLLTLMENVIETEREEDVMWIGGEESVALLLKYAIETEREEGIAETGGGGSIALLLNLTEDVIETERGRKDLVETGGGGSIALLLILMESVANDMVKEGGGGAPVYVDHRTVTRTGGGAGGGGGGEVDLAADDDVQRYVYDACVQCMIYTTGWGLSVTYEYHLVFVLLGIMM